jgi:hypothetical protein
MCLEIYFVQFDLFEMDFTFFSPNERSLLLLWLIYFFPVLERLSDKLMQIYKLAKFVGKNYLVTSSTEKIIEKTALSSGP